MGLASSAHAFLQGLPDRVLIDHEIRMSSANVRGNPDPIVADAQHDLAHPIDLSATGRHNAAGIAGSVLHGVLTKLVDRHQNRVSDNCNIIEMVDQRLRQLVSKLVDLGQLAQAGRPDDHLGVILDKRFTNVPDVLPQAKGAKDSARRLISGLLDFDSAPNVPPALHPKRKSHRKERMQTDQVANVQNHLIRTPKVSIKLRGVAVVPRPRPPWQSQLHGLHRMGTFGSIQFVLASDTTASEL